MLKAENLGIKENLNEQMLKLGKIYSPIAKELVMVEMEISKQTKTNEKTVDEIIEYFFKLPGKRLRPALVLLSAKAINPEMLTTSRELIYLATAFELIHSASLVHDDIVDGTLCRRGQVTMNNRFGNQIAVLAGDMLYSHAFTILTGTVDQKILKTISMCVKEMCQGEINELQSADYELERYLEIIEKKTASLMAASCKTPAMLLNADGRTMSGMEKYGLCFGMLYQIVDDCIDKNINVKGYDPARYIEKYASEAKQSLEVLSNSVYKEKLIDFVDFIVGYKDI